MTPNRLLVSPDRRSLRTADGAAFFWLGDTVWELFHRTTLDEAGLLLRDRAAKGFTVIQAVALAELDGLRTPSSNGHVPLQNDDPLQPVEDYWRYVDAVVALANSLGLYIGFLPTWGDKWNKGSWGAGPEIFNTENARAYGAWLGRRYRDAALVWILGGDRPCRDDRDVAINRAMAEGLREGDGGAHLMTFHPPGAQSSSKFVHGEPWLDFHMLQTGHDRARASWTLLEHDFELLPTRPFVNGEPPYEAHPNAFQGGDEGWLDQADIRRELYWTLCAGGAGFTYGVHAIWQLWDGKRTPVNGPRAPWKDSLALPGSAQVGHGRRLALARAHTTREPASWMVASPRSSGSDTIRACRGRDGSFALVYLPNCQRVKVHLRGLAEGEIAVTWFNPRTGSATGGGTLQGGDRYEQLQPPFDPEGRDWVLVLDSAAAHLPPLSA